jgi:hypothetical protein
MATKTVPAQASGGRVVEAWWFGFLVRSALALLALWTLSFPADRYRAFGLDASANFRYDTPSVRADPALTLPTNGIGPRDTPREELSPKNP